MRWWRCICATFQLFCTCMQAQKNMWIYSFFVSKTSWQWTKVQMARVFFFFFSFCVCALKRNSQEIRRENYAGCCYQLKVHSFLSQVPLLCICWCLFASKPKYFYCFVLKTCYSLFSTCWAYSVFNEYHILFFFFVFATPFIYFSLTVKLPLESICWLENKSSTFNKPGILQNNSHTNW